MHATISLVARELKRSLPQPPLSLGLIEELGKPDRSVVALELHRSLYEFKLRQVLFVLLPEKWRVLYMYYDGTV